jgi:hypothetical protein
MSTQAAFKKAVLAGMAASPFSGTVTVQMGSTQYSVTCCMVRSGDNKAQADELGLEHVRTLEAHLPKLTCGHRATLPRRPDVALDAVIYKGRTYKFVSIMGDDDVSPVWVISATAPF